MLKASVSCIAVIFRFEEFYIKPFLLYWSIALINSNKKDYVQNLPNFKIPGAIQYWNFWKLVTTSFFSLDESGTGLFFIIRVIFNEKLNVQSLPNFKIPGATHFWNFWQLITSQVFSLDEFCTEFFLLYVSIAIRKIIYKICLTSKFQVPRGSEIFNGL